MVRNFARGTGCASAVGFGGSVSMRVVAGKGLNLAILTAVCSLLYGEHGNC